MEENILKIKQWKKRNFQRISCEVGWKSLLTQYFCKIHKILAIKVSKLSWKKNSSKNSEKISTVIDKS